MSHSLISKEIIDRNISKISLKVPSIGGASIRDIKRLIDAIEQDTEIKFIRMEMGIPGLKTPKICIDAEIESIINGVTSIYPDIEGVIPLKEEISKFVKNFMNVEISMRSCVPSVGSMNGNYASVFVAGRRNIDKDTILFLDPGFPVFKQQVKMLGLKQESFDVYNFREEKLKVKLEGYLKEGKISTIIYSNPNNPSWICFTENELKIIGEFCTKYDIVAIEDLAYFGMDFRRDLSIPGKAPYQPSIANYTDNYILLISSSKLFSYAGERIGMLCISDKLFEREFIDLKRFYPSNHFGNSIIYTSLYCTTAGVSHSSQYGLLGLLKAVNNRDYNLIGDVREYGKKAEIIKKIFLENGFQIVYDKDGEELIADGFFFTFSYPGYTGDQLVEELFSYGISAISLSKTGSERTEGVRACVSLISRDQFNDLSSRLKMFNLEN